MKTLPLTFALGLALAACGQRPAEQTATATPTSSEGAATSSSEPASSATASEKPATTASKVVGLEGLGDLKFGQAIPAGSSWAVRGAQASDSCLIASSPDYPGVYAIVEGGKVRRITVGQRSDVKLVEGIGVGSTEAEVNANLPGFRSSPHKYEAAPAKYLTAPNAESGDPAVRFEIGQDGKVSLLHVGTMPQLAYVEGCA